MRYMTRLFAPLALASFLILAGCGALPAAQPPTTAPPSATPAATIAPPSATPAPTIAPPSATPAATIAPPSATPAATIALPTATPAPLPSASATAGPSAELGAEILYLSEGVLLALDPRSGEVRRLADEVRGVAATLDGLQLALVRGSGSEIWLLRRDGSDLRRLIDGERSLSDLSWAPDGASLVYSAAPTALPFPPDYPAWSSWCATAEVRLYDLERASELSLGPGCQPAFGPDGRRILLASPPEITAPGFSFVGARNAIRMLNRQGENAWSVAQSDGSGARGGLVVYAPSWAPNSSQVAYQRFLGYQMLVDFNQTEQSSSFQRNPAPLAVSAGWALPPRYAPDGRRMAVLSHNFSDARGFGGYDVWSVSLLDLEASSQVDLPDNTLNMAAAEIAELSMVTAAAWAPDGATLAVVLPTGWSPGLDSMNAHFPEPGPGELWIWRPGADPEVKLAAGLDYGTPLLWLPAP